jgi:hypothetical protein
MPDAEVAAQVGRTVDAVRQKREEMRIAKTAGGGRKQATCRLVALAWILIRV